MLTSDLVAPPMINTKIRCPMFLKSVDVLVPAELLQRQLERGKAYVILISADKDNH